MTWERVWCFCCLFKYILYFTLKDFFHLNTNWPLCLNKLVHFIFNFLLIRRPPTLQFVEEYGDAVADSTAAYLHPTVFSFVGFAFSECVIALFVHFALILSVSRVYFYFCINQMQQWKSIRWRTFSPVMEKWLRTRKATASAKRKKVIQVRWEKFRWRQKMTAAAAATETTVMVTSAFAQPSQHFHYTL